MSIEVRAIRKRFGSFHALDGVDLKVQSGELVALLGPSGSGKTTLLRVIAGLESPDDGQVLFEGRDATGRHARERGVGFVFQHYALFKHMTVHENIAFGLRVRPRATRPTEERIRERVKELLALVQLEGVAPRYPDQLSGGQRQRVALARALAVEPRVLLLDEPFGALDAKVRVELRRWLRRLHDQVHVTSVLVTHDQDEAMEVADRVVVMRSGKIEQVGTPDDVYQHPASPFVCDFMGSVNVFRGRIHAGHIQITSPGVNGSSQRLGASAPDPDSHPEQAIFVRPHMIHVERSPTIPWSVAATVRKVTPLGPIVRVILATPGDPEIQAELNRERFEELALRVGDQVYISATAGRAFAAADLQGTP